MFLQLHFKGEIAKKERGKQNKKGGCLSAWEEFRAFTTAQSNVHRGMLIVSFALSTFYHLCTDR